MQQGRVARRRASEVLLQHGNLETAARRAQCGKQSDGTPTDDEELRAFDGRKLIDGLTHGRAVGKRKRRARAGRAPNLYTRAIAAAGEAGGTQKVRGLVGVRLAQPMAALACFVQWRSLGATR